MSDFKAKMQCTKIVFGWGSAPDPAGELTTFPQTKPPSRLGGDRRLGRVHSRAFGTSRDLPYHLLYVRGAASVSVYCVNCTKFGQLILRIIIKIDATRCRFLRLKCTKIVFGSPRPRWGSLQRSPRPLSWIKGAYF